MLKNTNTHRIVIPGPQSGTRNPEHAHIYLPIGRELDSRFRGNDDVAVASDFFNILLMKHRVGQQIGVDIFGVGDLITSTTAAIVGVPGIV